MKRVRAIHIIIVVVVLAGATLLFTRGRIPEAPTPVTTFRSLPVYSNAAMVKDTIESHEPGLRSRTWKTPDDVPTVMRWYVAQLPQSGWTVTEFPDDPSSEGEQAVQVTKDEIRVTVIVEDEGGETEIVAYIHEDVAL